MATKLFDQVNVYDAATSINPVAAEDVQIDLATIGADVTVTFPAAGTEGQAIGVCLLSDSPGFSATYAGAVDVLVSSSLTQAGDCELFTYDAGASLWRLVAAYRQPAAAGLVELFAAINLYTAAPVAPVAGELAVIDLATIGADVTVDAAPGTADGQVLAYQVLTASPGFSVLPGTNLAPTTHTIRDAGDTLVFVWAAGPGAWLPIAEYLAPLAQPVLTTAYYTPPGPGATIDAVPGEMSSVDLALNGGNVDFNLNTAAASARDGQCVGCQLVATDGVSEIVFVGAVTAANLTTAGEVATFVWSASQAAWIPFSRI